MASTYDIGDSVRTNVSFLSTGSTAADPSGAIRFKWKTPDGTVTATTYSTGTSTGVIRTGAGTYHANLVTTGQGVYWTRFESTGSIVTAVEAYFLVRASQVTT